jgi:hypothetical protein
MQNANDHEFTFYGLVINSVIARKSDTQAICKLLARRPRKGKLTVARHILVDLVDQTRGNVFRCLGGKISPDFSQIEFSAGS